MCDFICLAWTKVKLRSDNQETYYPRDEDTTSALIARMWRRRNVIKPWRLWKVLKWRTTICFVSNKFKFLIHSNMSTQPNASRSGHVRFQLDSSGHAYPNQALTRTNNGTKESGSSVGRTIPLPPTSTPSYSDQWARHTSAPLPQIANDLNLIVIQAGLTDATLDLVLPSGKPATVPEASSMTIEIAGLPYYAPLTVRPSRSRRFVTGKDVVRAVVGSLRTPLRQEEILAVQGKRRINDHIMTDIRRCVLLPNGESTCLKGFTILDAQKNLWRLG
ncbi:hypothetical protein BDZ89DRAFT_1040446 [Hymenopellis radicata]|nr:hypothetical protein BDZ89DRAFT_1040446 [Hymenopellis radicata]